MTFSTSSLLVFTSIALASLSCSACDIKADGKVNPVIIAAAKVSGVDTIYKFGGAQGVTAIANGTETIEKVDKIVGPGNIFVATAKK